MKKSRILIFQSITIVLLLVTNAIVLRNYLLLTAQIPLSDPVASINVTNKALLDPHATDQAALDEYAKAIADLAASVYTAPSRKFVLKKLGDKGGVRIVFVRHGKRYTFEHDYEGTRGIQVWMRPVGTTDQGSLSRVYDPDGNGWVDSAATHGRDLSIEEANVGRPYWQREYTYARVALGAVLKRP